MLRHFLACCLSTSLLAAPPSAFLEQHCTGCHDAETKKGGLDLTALALKLDDRASFTTWVKVHDRVASGEMPPKKKARPQAEATGAFLHELDAQLTASDAARVAAEGRVRMRRMTRAEFENTLADLLALPRLDIQALLPADGTVAGFDKIAGGLDLSPAHLAAYAEAVEKALDAAIATRSTPPPVYKQRIYPAGLFKFQFNLSLGQFVLLKDKQNDLALPVRGGFEDKNGFVGDEGPDVEERRKLLETLKAAKSQSAVGLLNPNLAGYEAALNVSPIYAGMYRMKLSLWGFDWKDGKPQPCPAPQAAVLRAHEEGKQQEGGRLLKAFTAPSLQSNEEEITQWLDAHESIVFDPVSVPWNGLRIGQIAGRAAKHVGPGVAIDWFEIEGPLNPAWPPESHHRLFGDLPIAKLPAGSDVVLPQRDEVRSIGGYLPSMYLDLTPQERKPLLETVQSAQPEADARKLFAGFLPKAFRRPVTESEVAPYVALVMKRLAAKDCFEDAMRRAYVAVLTSPEFLFHSVEGNVFTLASRLSYWLWNGPPDEVLLAAARDGSLQRPEVLHREVDRLLADQRSERFIRDFADQWLELRRVNETTPDPQLYPEYCFLLHEGMVAETRAFLRELIATDAPATALVRPGFAMLTQRLAEHYGITAVSGVEVRRVALPAGSPRGGLLGHAAILKLTANGTTTTPVKRGVWAMDRLLNQPAPPPPPSVGTIDPDTRGATTVREQLDKHRNDASCAACHAKIDPAGFALESFDPIGGHRTRYRSTGKGDVPPEKGSTAWKVNYKLGPAVDASGELPDGRTFKDVNELNAILAEDPARLARAFVAHLSRYATGTEVSYADRAEIARIVESTAAKHYGLRSLIHALAESKLFTPQNPSTK
jgi:mono/diheme cytochrome c family protein